MSTSDRSPRPWARAAWLALILLAAVSGLGCLGRAHWLLGNLSHFRPQYAVVALLLFPACLALSRWRLAFACCVLVISAFNVAFLVPYLIDTPARAPRGAPAVSVLLWNTWRKNTDFARVNQALRYVDADVVLLQETTEEIRAHLPDLDGQYRVFTSGDDAVLTQHVRGGQVYRVEERGFSALHLELAVGGQAVDLIATHLAAPLSSAAAEQRAEQLDALAAWVEGRTKPVVILGDLNTTPWSHEIEDLVGRCRLRDSLVGCGLQPTWPFHNVFTSLLRIPLDHCLHTAGVVAFDRAVGEPAGSNHRPLFVRIALDD